jgi:hypothetical protein
VLTYGMHHPPVPEGRPDLVEPVEHTAEAALALCTGHGLTGRIAFTRALLDELHRPVADLDGYPLTPD